MVISQFQHLNENLCSEALAVISDIRTHEWMDWQRSRSRTHCNLKYEYEKEAISNDWNHNFNATFLSCSSYSICLSSFVSSYSSWASANSFSSSSFHSWQVISCYLKSEVGIFKRQILKEKKNAQNQANYAIDQVLRKKVRNPAIDKEKFILFSVYEWRKKSINSCYLLGH